MKEFMGSRWMVTDYEMNERPAYWINGLVADFCHQGIIKFMRCLVKCPSHNVYTVYTEK
jgi:hypothetical protein